MQQVFSFGNVELSHDSQANIIIMVHKGFAKSSDFRAACEKTLEIIAKHKTYKMLIDQRKMGDLSHEYVLWLTNNYYAREYAILKRRMQMALVMPESAFGMVTAQVVTSEVTKGMSSRQDDTYENSPRTFMEPEAARHWLLSSK